MYVQRKWFFAFIALVVVSLAVGIGQIWADGPTTSEPEPAVPPGPAQDGRLDPEVAGLPVEAQATAVASTEVDSEGNPTTAIDAPAQSDAVDETLSPDSPQATVTYFKRYPGTAFQPRDSDTGYDYFGNGCISAKGTDYFTVDLQLPTDAEIDYVRFYFYDTSSANARMYLTWYDGAGAYGDVVSVDSSGTSGYGTAGVFTSYIVDPINQSINLVWRPNVTGSSMALCGARIRYQVTVNTVNLPAILNQNAGG